MGLIRRPDIQQIARAALVMNLGDLAREGERAAVSAREEAARILVDARAERDALIKGAVDEGKRQGFEKGLTEGRTKGEEEGKREALRAAGSELERVRQAWDEAIGAFESARTEMLAALRRDALKLAVLLAERVVRRTVEVDERVVVRQLEAALEMISSSTRVVVAVHPDDEPVLRGALPAMVAKFSDVTHAELALDGTVERGGCVVRTNAGGVIDASIRTQVERLAASIGVGLERVDAEGTTGASEPKLAGSSERSVSGDEKSRSAA